MPRFIEELSFVSYKRSACLYLAVELPQKSASYVGIAFSLLLFPTLTNICLLISLLEFGEHSSSCLLSLKQCLPVGRAWPGPKCDRCKHYGYECTANEKKRKRSPGTSMPGRSGSRILAEENAYDSQTPSHHVSVNPEFEPQDLKL